MLWTGSGNQEMFEVHVCCAEPENQSQSAQKNTQKNGRVRIGGWGETVQERAPLESLTVRWSQGSFMKMALSLDLDLGNGAFWTKGIVSSGCTELGQAWDI